MQALTPGTVVAKRYRLERQLGEGGMGVVWAATHTVTRKRLALKFLKARAASQYSRFVREARAASAVDHPNVVTVHDIFELDDAMPVMVMELLEGESLQALLARKRKLDAAELCQVMLPVVSAVGTAHAAGIIHRDLKPENIFLARGDRGDAGTVVKVLDFGIAKLAPQCELPAEPGITQTGALLGTPYYMSPEQAAGEHLDHRSDIWSLGIICYEALSGVLPTRADSVGGVLKIVLNASIAPLADRGLELPRELVAMVTRMLSEHASDRPGDLREVCAVLERYLPPQASVEVPAFGAAEPEKPVDTELSSLDTEEYVQRSRPTEPVPDSQEGADTVLASAETLAHPRASTVGPVAAPARSIAARASRWPLALVAVAALAAAVALYLSRRPDAPPAQTASAAATPLREPQLGLAALADFRDRPAASIERVGSAAFWEAAANDFTSASAQDGAPVMWAAAQRFAEGMAQLEGGKLDASATSHRAAIALRPEWALPRVGLSSALVLLHEPEAALAEAREAQRLERDWWGGIAAAANVYAKERRIEDAIDEYKRALDMAPDKVHLMVALALAYHAARLDLEADRYAGLALAQKPDLVDLRLLVAERALERGDGQAALVDAEKAVAGAPRNVAARLALADALALLGREADALQAYREVVRIADVTGAIGAPPDRLALARQAVMTNVLPPPRTPRTPTAPSAAPPRSVPPAPAPDSGRTLPPNPHPGGPGVPVRTSSCGCSPSDMTCLLHCEQER